MPSIFLRIPYLNTTTDLLLGQRAHTGALNIGASYTESASMTIPEGVSGSYYVFVLADNGDQVFEAGAEANNSGFDSVSNTNSNSTC